MQEDSVQKLKKSPSIIYPVVSPPQKVTIIYNKVNNLSHGNPEDLLADEDTIVTAKAILKALQKDFGNVDLFEVREDNFTDLLTFDTDFFFNLCYGIGSIPKTEHEIPKILDATGIAYTGADSNGLMLTTDKVATKKIFAQAKIPTPEFQLFLNGFDKLHPSLKFPLIVKPQSEDCSLGVHNDAVVLDEKQLRKKISQILNDYKEAALVEQFINTRELNVTIIGNGRNLEMLPISEIVFGSSFDLDNKWKIVDFDAKWLENSDSFKDTIGVCPAKLDPDIEEIIKKYAITAYKKCGCRDYARIDIRLDEDNTPYFLEINLNPGIGPNDGAIRSAKVAGYSYSSFLRKLISVSTIRHFNS